MAEKLPGGVRPTSFKWALKWAVAAQHCIVVRKEQSSSSSRRRAEEEKCKRRAECYTEEEKKTEKSEVAGLYKDRRISKLQLDSVTSGGVADTSKQRTAYSYTISSWNLVG